MANESKVADLNGLYSKIFEKARFVARERSLLPQLVDNKVGKGMAERTGKERTRATIAETAEGAEPTRTVFGSGSAWAINPVRLSGQYVLTDQQVATDEDDAMRDAAKELGSEMATKIDLLIANKFGSFTASKGNGGSALTMRRVGAAMAKLRGNNADGFASVVLHPYAWHDIWIELGTPSANQAFLGEKANEALRQYYVGQFIGASWVQSNNVGTAGGTAVGAAFVREAIALDTRKAMNLAPQRDESTESTELNMHAWVGCGITRDAWGCKIISTATEPS